MTSLLAMNQHLPVRAKPLVTCWMGTLVRTLFVLVVAVITIVVSAVAVRAATHDECRRRFGRSLSGNVELWDCFCR